MTATSPRMLHRGRTAPRGAAGRAAQMLEFALLLPLFLFIMLFTLDMGHMVLMAGAVQDATFAAARAGAQVGAAGNDSAGPSYDAIQQSIAEIPGGDTHNIVSYQVLSGSTCTASGDNSYVAISVDYASPLLTPGLGNLMRLFSGGAGANIPDTWTLHAKAVARCEVVR